MRPYLVAAPFVLIAAAACAQDYGGAPNVPGQQPAFAGQTRAPLVDSGVELGTETVADGLVYPWGLAVLPGGGYLVTERPGRLRHVDADGTLSEPITGLPDVDARGQGGLLDVALDPDFANNRLIYWSYAEPRGDGENGTSVARGELNQDMTGVENAEVIFRQEPAWASTKHFGSRLVFDRDGNLYVTLGERSLPEPRQLAQDLGAHLGKVVRITPDGGVPDDNPFVGQAGALPEIWSYGHRNVQGAALHPETGELWTIEHGPQGGDEVNAPEAGLNYGWPVITYGEDYGGGAIGEGITAKDGMEQPLYYWDPVIAPGGMTFYDGDAFPDWQGDLVISGLKAQGIVRLDLDGKTVVGEERLAGGLGRVRDVAVDHDGGILALTDAGDMVKLTPASS